MGGRGEGREGGDGLRDEDNEVREEGERKNINSADKSFGRGSVLLSRSPVDSQHPILPLLQDVTSCGNTQGMRPLLFSAR